MRGTCEAAEAALVHGVAMNLAGGTHHAFPHRGEGFCTFNDVAVAIADAGGGSAVDEVVDALHVPPGCFHGM